MAFMEIPFLSDLMKGKKVKLATVSRFFFVQNPKTQFRIFRNSDAKNLKKLSFCLKTQFQTFQKQGISEHFHQKLLEKGYFQLIFI